MKTTETMIKLSLKKILFITLLLLSVSTYAQKSTPFVDSTAISKEVTSKYFTAYFNLDFDSMQSMMHDNISFEDPTARFVFGGKKIEGKTNVYENFKKSYSSIIEMNQETIRTIFSSNTGIFEINLTWKFKKGPDKVITINMPLIIILTVENGKVIEHRDYGDYNYFIKQYSLQINKED